MAGGKGNGADGAREKTNQENSPAEGKGQQPLPLRMEARILSIRPEEAIKANVSVNINGAFAVRGIKVVEGSNGLFVSMPSYKSGNEYRDICFPVTAESRQQLHDAVLGAYEQAVAQGQSSVQKHHEMKQQAPEGQPVQTAGM